MAAIGDFVFVVAMFAGPPLVLGTCVWLRVARQPRWVLATAAASAGVMALAWVTYWYLWGQAFEYADAYTPVPTALDRASDIASATCFASTLLVSPLGASRLVVTWRNRHEPGLGLSA